MNKNLFITSEHLAKKVIVYIRQSTMQQVINHKESLNMQYNLKTKAIDYGWRSDQIEVIDCDLGKSGQSQELRKGFKYIMAEVALGNVGIIFAYDATRLSRNCSDWFQLLDICAFKNCLIGDFDNIYDPSTMNGRLLLGIKGQLAEIEISTIKSRLIAGLANKAQRGDLELKLPIGFVRVHKEVEKDPNAEVQSTINMLFNTFFRAKSASMTLKHFTKNNLLIPRYNLSNQLYWKKPNHADILCFLKNPAYAGTYAYGKTQTMVHPSETHKKYTKVKSQTEWKHVIHNKYPSYISWEQYEYIQKILKENYANYKKNTQGSAKRGSALLQGIIYCGKCGYKMVVEYNKGKTYLCNHLARSYNQKLCQTIIAAPIDNIVVENFFKVISKIELNVYEEVIKKQEDENSELKKAHLQKLTRLKYQAQLAESRYNQVDPNNRLVADELERKWEAALLELKKAEQINIEPTNAQNCVTDELKKSFLDIGKYLPELWNNEILDNRNRKLFLRCLIERVVLERVKPDKVKIRIMWKGSAVSEYITSIAVSGYKQLSNYETICNIVTQENNNGKSDEEIVTILNSNGFKTHELMDFTIKNVQTLRLKLKLRRRRGGTPPVNVKGSLTIRQLSDMFNLERYWFTDRIHRNQIKVDKHPEYKIFLFPDNKQTIVQFRLLIEGKLNSLNFIGGY